MEGGREDAETHTRGGGAPSHIIGGFPSGPSFRPKSRLLLTFKILFCVQTPSPPSLRHHPPTRAQNQLHPTHQGHYVERTPLCSMPPPTIKPHPNSLRSRKKAAGVCMCVCICEGEGGSALRPAFVRLLFGFCPPHLKSSRPLSSSPDIPSLSRPVTGANPFISVLGLQRVRPALSSSFASACLPVRRNANPCYPSSVAPWSVSVSTSRESPSGPL